MRKKYSAKLRELQDLWSREKESNEFNLAIIEQMKEEIEILGEKCIEDEKELK